MVSDFKLSKHFSFFEMTTTEHRDLLEVNRQVFADKGKLARGVVLCETLLEPIRVHFNSPVSIHSSYRCEQLNKAIGGSTTSQHMLFEAADFHVVGKPLQEVFDWIRKDSGLLFGQLILEGYSSGNYSWIHISLGYPFREKNNQEALLFDGKKYTVAK